MYLFTVGTGAGPTILVRMLEVTLAFSIFPDYWLLPMQQCMDLVIG